MTVASLPPEAAAGLRPHAALAGIVRTAGLLHRRLEQAVAAQQITPQQYTVLTILRDAGEAGLPTLAIGTRMIERAPGVTRLVDRLEAQGLVARTRARDDRRQVRCTLTERGHAVLAALEEPVQAADAATVSALDAAEFEQLDELLHRLSEAVRAQLGDDAS